MSKDVPGLSINDRQSRNVLTVVLMLMVFSVSSAGYGLSSQLSPSRPGTVSAAAPPAQQETSSADTAAQNLQLPFSKPNAISIPSLQIESELIEVGKNPDGTIEIPAGEDYDKAAWYKHGAAPGQIGSAVIEGHVDSIKTGPSIFFTLGSVQPGQSVFVDRADGARVEFVVEKVAEFNKDNFPTEQVYGGKDYAALTLITCSGTFDTDSGEYQSNIVVTTRLKAIL